MHSLFLRVAHHNHTVLAQQRINECPKGLLVRLRNRGPAQTSSLSEEHSICQVLDPRSLFVAHIFKADCIPNLVLSLIVYHPRGEGHIPRHLERFPPLVRRVSRQKSQRRGEAEYKLPHCPSTPTRPRKDTEGVLWRENRALSQVLEDKKIGASEISRHTSGFARAGFSDHNRHAISLNAVQQLISCDGSSEQGFLRRVEGKKESANY